MVTVESLASQIRSLEAEIATVKAQFERLLVGEQGASPVGLNDAPTRTDASSKSRETAGPATSSVTKAETVTFPLLASRIKGIEVEIAVLKTALARLGTPRSAGIKTFGDLYGILADAGDITEEEIDAVLYRIDEDDEQLFGEPE